MMVAVNVVEVRFPCEDHGKLFSHYTNTKTRPFKKCPGGRTVEVERDWVFSSNGPEMGGWAWREVSDAS